MAEEPKIILALDYGGTKHTAAVAAVGSREWLAIARVSSPPGADAAWDQAAMLGLARQVLAGAPGRLAAVGVSFGGPVDAAAGVVRLSHHVPGWENTPLAARLAEEFGAPVVIGNDANVAALGESAFGAGRGCRSLLYVTVSTGIGGGWVLGGRIWDGADGTAGEIGHIVVLPGGAECICGKRGCLEAEACGRAIARRMREAMGPDAPAEELAKVTGEWVARQALAGNEPARRVMDEAARLLGQGLGGAINLMNPERVVLGGGVTKSGERWWRLVRESARYHALPEMRVDIVPAEMDDDAPLWGAVALADGK